MGVLLEQPSVELARRNLRVCVLDSDLEQRYLSTNALERAGFPVATTASSDEALRMIERKECEVILLDSETPELKSLEFLEGSLRLNPEVHVILMTRFYSVDSAIEAIKHGAYDYLCKPLNVSRLTKSLDELAQPLLQTLPAQAQSSDGSPQSVRLEEVRRHHIRRVLEICNGNRVHAARLLGIGRTSLYRFLKRAGKEDDPAA